MSDSVHKDADSGMFWAAPSEFHEEVVILEDLSQPLVTAVDVVDSKVWFLN